ncbi:hypothetical protein PoB_000775000 [Plakobranchus ocellatus]|uniref:Uncharacterized protein n=1 Tax=Plakobranchus ocellatus TaxID=259542 RepID=A0AAV3YDY2_9GAST|nr:hypothetical protein PoB_000775000 [Plakobranchus ocellatus]
MAILRMRVAPIQRKQTVVRKLCFASPVRVVGDSSNGSHPGPSVTDRRQAWDLGLGNSVTDLAHQLLHTNSGQRGRHAH